MSIKEKPKTCVIYCRVSSTKQAQEGDSLEKQERICRDYAKKNDLEVLVQPFKEAFTGRADSRPKLDEMMGYLFTHQEKIGYVIVFSIDRLTRGGALSYSVITDKIRGLGVEVKDTQGVIQEEMNLMEEYGDIASRYKFAKKRPSKMSENIIADSKQDIIDDNLRRLIGRQIDLSQIGYQIGNTPFGFESKKKVDIGMGTKKKTVLFPKEEEAVFIRKIFQLRAEGILDDKEIVDQINRDGYRSRTQNRWNKEETKIIGKRGNKKLTKEQMKKYLQMPIYTGIMKKAYTNQLPIKAQFDGLVPLDIWNKANKGKVYIKDLGNDEYQWIRNYDEAKRAKTKVSKEYPYKHVIKCPLCGKNFWASASRGKSGKKFPAYHCSGIVKKKPTHKHYGVSADEFNETVESFIKNLTFTDEHKAGFELVMKDLYRKKHKDQIATSKDLARIIQDKRTELETLYEKLERATKEIVERRLEEKIELLDSEIKGLELNRNKSETTEHDFVSYLKHALFLLEHPSEILLKPRKKEDQQAIWSLVFEELPTYEEIKTGTPKLTLCFNIKTTTKSGLQDLVRPEGLEPPTSEE